MKSVGFLILNTVGALVFCGSSIGQKTRLYIKVLEEDTRQVTPAMVCITSLATKTVLLPPGGKPAGEATYPDISFKGVDFSNDKNWIGPLRRTNGPGGVNGQRTYVYGTAPSMFYWPDSLMYQTSGDFFIDIDSGSYRIAIAHGSEYLPAFDTITIAQNQSTNSKQYTLKRWINLPSMGWYSGDVHAHHPLTEKKYRDYVLQLAKAENLHVTNMLQMGDRSSTYFLPQTYDKQQRISYKDIVIASGQEDPRYHYGHVIALNTTAMERDTSHYNHYDIVFDKVHAKPGGLIGFAHFAYGGEGVIPGMAVFATKGVDFVELMQNTKLNAPAYYQYLNLGFRLAATAGSDFPWGSTVGDCRTYVYTGHPFSADKWFAGLKAGRTFVSSGPALFLTAAGKLPGTEVSLTKGAVIRLKVKSLSNNAIGIIEKVQLVNNDGVVSEAFNTKGLDSLELTLTHSVSKSQWIAAVVFCRNGALAHTSPVYFRVDGKSWYDEGKAPAIVKELLQILEQARQIERSKQPMDQGMLDRILAAEIYYKHLPASIKKR